MNSKFEYMFKIFSYRYNVMLYTSRSSIVHVVALLVQVHHSVCLPQRFYDLNTEGSQSLESAIQTSHMRKCVRESVEITGARLR